MSSTLIYIHYFKTGSKNNRQQRRSDVPVMGSPVSPRSPFPSSPYSSYQPSPYLRRMSENVDNLQLQYDREGYNIRSNTGSINDDGGGIIDGRFSSSFSDPLESGFVAIDVSY